MHYSRKKIEIKMMSHKNRSMKKSKGSLMKMTTSETCDGEDFSVQAHVPWIEGDSCTEIVEAVLNYVASEHMIR